MLTAWRIVKTRHAGAAFDGEGARLYGALQVPSAIIETEANFLLNPAHAAFASVKISAAAPFALDTRLIAPLKKS